MLPSIAGLLAMLVARVLLGLLSVALAAMISALRISRLEPA